MSAGAVATESAELARFLDVNHLASVREGVRAYGTRTPRGSPAAPRFRVLIRQQPLHGLAFGDEPPPVKGHRPMPLDPPLICELVPNSQDDR